MLRVVGMAATMSLKQHGADDAINRRITVLVLNKQTQEGIEHENAESNAMDIAQPDSLKQLAPSATAPASQTPEPQAVTPTDQATPPPAADPVAQSQTSPAIAPAGQAPEQPAAAPAPTNRDSQPEVTPVSMDISDFYQTFFDEADELLADMEQHLLELDPLAPDIEPLNAIFRAAHSIKGGAATFGFSVLQETTHLLENLLDGARRQEMSLSTEIINLFLETKDIMQEQLDAYKTSQQPDAESFEYICQALRQLALEAQQQQEAPAAQPAVQQPVVKPAAVPAAIEGGMRISLNGLKASEIPLMLEELGNLGEVKDPSSDGTQSGRDVAHLRQRRRHQRRAVLRAGAGTNQLLDADAERTGPLQKRAYRQRSPRRNLRLRRSRTPRRLPPNRPPLRRKRRKRAPRRASPPAFAWRWKRWIS